MAKLVGAPFVTFSEMTLDAEELDALIEEAGEMNFPDEESTELVEAQWLRKYAGNLGYIQLGFVYQGLVFLHETTTEWYERFQTLLEDIETFRRSSSATTSTITKTRTSSPVGLLGVEVNGQLPRQGSPRKLLRQRWTFTDRIRPRLSLWPNQPACRKCWPSYWWPAASPSL